MYYRSYNVAIERNAFCVGEKARVQEQNETHLQTKKKGAAETHEYAELERQAGSFNVRKFCKIYGDFQRF